MFGFINNKCYPKKKDIASLGFIILLKLTELINYYNIFPFYVRY